MFLINMPLNHMAFLMTFATNHKCEIIKIESLLVRKNPHKGLQIHQIAFLNSIIQLSSCEFERYSKFQCNA